MHQGMTSLRILCALVTLSALTACGDDPCAGLNMSWGGERGARNIVDNSCGGGGGGGGAEPCNQLDPSNPNYCG
jgi:hypothetical protein